MKRLGSAVRWRAGSIILVVALASGCGNETPGTSRSSVAPPASASVVTPSLAPTPPSTGTPGEQPSTAASAAPNPPDAVVAAGTFRGGLWAVQGSELLLSIDGGTSWRRTPIPVAERWRTEEFILDADHAWSVTAGPGSTPSVGSPGDVLRLTVHRTSDGGRTWQQTILPGNFAGTIQRLVFVDQAHGYLLCAATQLSTGISTMLSTDDGGRTWTVASTTSWLGSMFAVSDAQTVWAGSPQEAGVVQHPILEVSRDGGGSWQDARLPGLVGKSGGAMLYLTEPPLFLDPATGIVSIVSFDGQGQGLTTLYETGDGGRSWTRAGALPFEAAAGPAVLDARDWLMAFGNPSAIQGTADGGATWHRVGPTGLPYTGLLSWIGAVTGARAAAFVPLGAAYSDPDAGVLLLSADGGRSWQPALLGVPRVPMPSAP